MYSQSKQVTSSAIHLIYYQFLT